MGLGVPTTKPNRLTIVINFQDNLDFDVMKNVSELVPETTLDPVEVTAVATAAKGIPESVKEIVTPEKVMLVSEMKSKMSPALIASVSQNSGLDMSPGDVVAITEAIGDMTVKAPADAKLVSVLVSKTEGEKESKSGFGSKVNQEVDKTEAMKEVMHAIADHMGPAADQKDVVEVALEIAGKLRFVSDDF